MQSLNAINNQDKNKFNCIEVINNTITALLVKITYVKKLENKQDIDKSTIKGLPSLRAINNVKKENKVPKSKNTEKYYNFDNTELISKDPVDIDKLIKLKINKFIRQTERKG